MKEIKEIRIDWHTIFKLLTFLGLVVIIYYARKVLLTLIVGVVLSLGLDPLISFISEKVRIKRWLAILFVAVLIIALFVITLYIILPLLFNQLVELIQHIGELFSNLPAANLILPYIQNIKGNDLPIVDILWKSTSLPNTFFDLLKNFAFLLAGIVITLYLLMEKNGARNMLKAVLPYAYEKTALEIFDGFALKMRRWLGTQILLSLFVGLIVFIGLTLLGLKYALLLGIVAGILEVVPVIGPVLTALLTFVLAVSDSINLAIYSVVFFIFVQQFENHLLIPILVGKTMKVHPVMVVVSILAGGEIAGFVGILLATPLAILIQEVFNYIAKEKEKMDYRFKF